MLTTLQTLEKVYKGILWQDIIPPKHTQMAYFDENDMHFGAHSPRFLKQRKIAYVDNPFDEQASQSMVQKCDVKYMNFPRNRNGGKARNGSESSGQNVAGKGQQRNDQDDLWPLGVLVKGDGNDLASAEQDWSCLFSPVQVLIYSPV